MSSDPAANADRWAAWPAHAVSPAQGDLNLAPQAARAPQGAAGRGRRGQTPPALTPRQVRAAARASNHAAATAPHTRREQANSRAALTVARELLRCRLLEGGRDVLLERVAELLDAAASGTPPFCVQLPPQTQGGPYGSVMCAHATSGRLQGPFSVNTPADTGRQVAPASSQASEGVPTVAFGFGGPPRHHPQDGAPIRLCGMRGTTARRTGRWP